MLNPQITTAPAKNVAASNDAAAKNTAQTADPFSAVLARQIEDKNSSNAQAAKTSDSKTKSDAAKTQDATASQDASATTAQAAPPAPDAATLASMLLGTVKPAAAQTAPKTQDKPDTAAADAAALAGAIPGVPVAVQAQVQTPVTDSGKPSHAIGNTAKGQNTIGPARDTATLKTDTALQAAPKAGTEQFKSAELSAHLAGAKTADPAPALAQPAGTPIAAAMPPEKSANSVASTTIEAPVTSSAWPAEFAQKVSWISTQQSQVAQLHLNPPDLGPMSVTLSVSDNQATAVFSSPHSAVRDAIENAMPRLRESLAENGIMLGNTSVNDQAPRDSGTSGSSDQRPGNPRSMNVESSVAPSVSLPAMPTQRHNGMVDTFA